MTTWGLSATGFYVPSAAEILAALEADQHATIDPTLDVGAESVIGEQNASFATQLAKAWEALGATYDARSPRGASYTALDDVSAITGAVRRAATKGAVALEVQLGAGVTLATGKVASVLGDSGNRWVTTAGAKNTGSVPAWIPVAAEAETAGVVPAYAGTITVIATPTTGWLGVRNPLDAVPGLPEDSDPMLRARREQELSRAGSSPVDALRAVLLEVTGVSQAVVWENPTDYTDADGRPPHSIEAMVLGGADADVAAAVWRKGGGIATHGGASGTVVDASGTTRTVRWTRPADVPVYASVRLVIDLARYAGDAAVQAAVAAVTATQQAGALVSWWALGSAAAAVPGVQRVEGAQVGRSVGTLASADLLVSARERALLDTSRVTVSR